MTSLLPLFLLWTGPVFSQSLTGSGPSGAAPGRTAELVEGGSDPAPGVYYTADEMPAYPGGTAAFLRFLQAKLQYPQEARLQNVKGKVYVRFVVDEQGRIRDAEVVRGLGAGLDQEALRLVRIMPWWTPGRISGKPVRVACTLPITFKILVE
jgi:protein TonB